MHLNSMGISNTKQALVNILMNFKNSRDMSCKLLLSVFEI